MDRWQERYWLRHASRGPETDERRAEDFVCCEVPVGGDGAMALEVFTSRVLAKAERLGLMKKGRVKFRPFSGGKALVRGGLL
jgi:hypothetical protein